MASLLAINLVLSLLDNAVPLLPFAASCLLFAYSTQKLKEWNKLRAVQFCLAACFLSIMLPLAKDELICRVRGCHNT